MDVRPAGGANRTAGFTLLEIMLATAILTLGLVGILALFPIAIDSGKKVMERSTAVTIAKSVGEAIRAGIRNQKRTNYKHAEPFTYFIFNHDGVLDPIPRDTSQERPDKDYYILLPQFVANRTFESREAAVRSAKEFVYPEDDNPPNGGGDGDPMLADNDGDDGPDGKSILVKKVYTMGNRLPRPEDTGEAVLDDQKNEMLKQFSFAFSIRESPQDTNLIPREQGFRPGNNLYHVRVMVFRRFFYNEEKVRQEKKGEEPIYELDFEVGK